MTSTELRTPDVTVVMAPGSDPFADTAMRTRLAASLADLQPYLDEPIEQLEAGSGGLAAAVGSARGHVVIVIDADVVIDESTLAGLAIAVVESGGASLALPMTWPAGCAGVPRALVGALTDALQEAGTLTAAVTALIDAGVPWVAALRATTASAPRRPEPRVIPPAPRTVIPPAWTPDAMGRYFDVANPAAVTVGPQTYFQPGCVVKTYWPTERIQIGGYCCIAAEVHIVHGGGPLRAPDGRVVPGRLMHSHHPACATSFPIDRLLPDDAKPFDQGPFDGSLTSKPLVIGSDVWIGYRALVYGSVTVGHGAIIGVGAVVVGDVPPYAVVAGNPARVVRSRFSPAVVERLLAVAWWDWPEEIVRARWEWFTKPIAEFLALAEA